MPEELKYKITTEGQTAGAEAVAAAVGKVEKSTGNAAKATGEAAVKGNQAAEAFGQLQGAATGAAGGVFKVSDALKTLTSAARANPIGFIATTVIAALPAIRSGLDAMVGSYTASIERMRAADAKGAADLKARLDAVVAANKAAMEQISSDSTKASDSYKTLVGIMDEARKRADALNAAELERRISAIDAEEQKALSAATSDPQRDAIRRGASRQREDLRAQVAETRNVDDALNAGNRIGITGEREREARARLQQAELEASAARATAAAKLDVLKRASEANGPASAAAKDAYADASVADAIAKAAEERLAAVRGATEALLAQIDADKRAAEDALELANIRKETLQNARRATSTARSTEDRAVATERESERKARQDRIGETYKAQRTALERDDYEGANKAAKEREELQAADRASAAAAAVTKEAAAAVAGAAGAADPLREAVIQFGGTTLKTVGGLKRDLDATRAALDAQTRQMERLASRVENLSASSQ